MFNASFVDPQKKKIRPSVAADEIAKTKSRMSELPLISELKIGYLFPTTFHNINLDLGGKKFNVLRNLNAKSTVSAC